MRRFACYDKNAIADIVVPVPDIYDELVVKCLGHMRVVTPEPHNVILVESSGRDFSFSKSVNEGFKNAETDLYIFYNDDVFPRPGWLTGFVEAFADYPNLGICGAVQFDPNSISSGWPVRPDFMYRLQPTRTGSGRPGGPGVQESSYDPSGPWFAGDVLGLAERRARGGQKERLGRARRA